LPNGSLSGRNLLLLRSQDINNTALVSDYFVSLKVVQKFLRGAFEVGLTDREILPDESIRWLPNSYVIDIQIPTVNFYEFLLAGRGHRFEFPEGVIRPERKETGNVAGCGILMGPDNNLTIFFTFNGILIG
jgi:hypothetical protein